MEKIFGKNWLTDTLVEVAGSILTGIAVYNFAAPAGFPMTGFSGLALIAFRLWGLPIGWMTIVLNIPVAFLCYRLLGRASSSGLCGACCSRPCSSTMWRPCCLCTPGDGSWPPSVPA